MNLPETITGTGVYWKFAPIMELYLYMFVFYFSKQRSASNPLFFLSKEGPPGNDFDASAIFDSEERFDNVFPYP